MKVEESFFILDFLMNTPENIFVNNNSPIQQDTGWFKNISDKPFDWPSKIK